MQVEYLKKFRKSFNKLPDKVRDSFNRRFTLFTQNRLHPLLNNHAVDAAYPGCRSINITGDYRAIFIDDGDVVTFVAIGTHSELYR